MILHNLQPEQQLCLILARNSLSPELAVRADLLVRGGLDWDRVWDLSVRHRIFPLVFRHLERFESGLVPDRVLRLFHVLFLANSGKSEMLAKELARIIEALGKTGIAVVPFKGPLLTDLVWGDHRLWSGQDLDLLVRQTDLRRAKDLLCAEGYHVVLGSNEEGKPHRAFLGRGKPVTLTLARRDVTTTKLVELHESLFPWSVRHRSLDEQVWEDVKRGHVFGAAALLLPHFWNFILLSLHAYEHLFALLKWVSELHELWNSDVPNRDMILEKGEQIGLKTELLLSIAVCEHLLGDESKVSSGSNKVLVTRLSRDVLRRPLSRPSVALFRLRLPGSIVGKLNRLATGIFAATIIERHLLPLPRWLHFLYYGIRPVRLALKYGVQRPLRRRQKPRVQRSAQRPLTQE